MQDTPCTFLVAIWSVCSLLFRLLFALCCCSELTVEKKKIFIIKIFQFENLNQLWNCFDFFFFFLLFPQRGMHPSVT